MNNRWLLSLISIVLLVVIGLFYHLKKEKTETLYYKDSNENGVWDDVELFIEQESENELQEKALIFRFKSFQKVLLNPALGKKLKKAKEMS